MNERWICTRCFTSAEPTAAVCPNCGTPRDASVAAPPAGETPAQPESGWSAGPEPAAPVPAPAFATDPSAEAAQAGDPSERWVCKRCFASNEGSAAECTNCGLLRGAEPPSDDPGTWAAAAGAPPPAGRKFPWQWVIVGVIALAVIGGSIFFAARRDDGGEITDAGDMSVFDLQVGDCFDTSTDSTEVETVRGIPCDEPHVYEMYWTGDYPSDDEPSDAESTSWVEDQCLPAFADYVGIDYSSSIYYTGYLAPTSEGWSDGDREFACYLHNESETAMSGSAQGSAQ